ncbi:MAG: PmoA family protein [Clostridia bacterium]|nr:PmoA family protein [Clostridia bacterium]
MKLTVAAGNHDRVLCPVNFKLPLEAVGCTEGKKFVLTAPNGKSFPCAVKAAGEEAELCFVLDWLGSGEELELELGTVDCKCTKMHLADTEKGIAIKNGEKEITHYYTATDLAKPHLGHFREAYGTEITRIDNTTREHPHHRALWISHGDVNGVDTWNELPEHGYIRVQEIRDRFESSVWTGFTAENLWTDHYGKSLCTETTSFKVYNTPDTYTIIDIDLTLTAAFGEVTLGPTKEAGPLAIRMADDLRVVGHPGEIATGTMEAAQGAINEKEIWMKRAPWVDYWGTKDGHRCGVAIFDCAENEMFPTYWHARDYGLMAVNNFYVGGSRVIPEGESKNWKFRIVAHNGNTAEADIRGKYLDYYASPVVKAE